MNLLSALLIKAKLFILLIPFVVTYAGAGLNQAVLAANGGKFPVMLNDRAAGDKNWHVDENGFMDNRHYRMTDQTHLNFLADYINLNDEVILSPGDLLIDLGDFLLFYAFTVWSTIVVLELHRQTSVK